MLKSMTGYGRAQQQVDGWDITVEFKSVNHRYFEFSSRIPRSYGYLEEKLKGFLQTAISRGKAEVALTIQSGEGRGTAVHINHGLALSYLTALRQFGKVANLRDELTLTSISRLPDIFTVDHVEEDEEAVWLAVEQVAKEAADRFVEMRRREGERLEEDLRTRLGTIAQCLGKVEERSPKTVADYRARLTGKLQEILGERQIEESRILTEAALFAEKIAVDEETVRLRSHLAQFAEILTQAEPVGRKLDFLIQECNREVNTIGSKAQDLEVTRLVVEIKSEIEKLREQIQNIE